MSEQTAKPSGSDTLREISTQPETLKLCMNRNAALLQTVSASLKAADLHQVFLVARGTSANAGVYLQHLSALHWHKLPAFVPSVIMTAYGQTIDFDHSLLVAISQSGKGKDIVEVTKQARSAGAITLAITNEPKEALAQTAEQVLLTELGEQKSFTATKTYTATLYLAYRLVSLLKADTDSALALSDDEIIAALAAGLGYRPRVQALVGALRNTLSAFVLGRGLSLSLALEFALKLKETAYMHASGFSCAEFHHGPVAAVTKNTPLIFFGLDKTTNGDIKAMAQKCASLCDYSLMITNDKNLTECCTETLFIDEADDEKAFFSAAILLQIYTYELAMLRGNNPDFAQVLDDIDTY